MTLLCFSNQRWDADLQRPKQLLTRFTNQYRVFFIEEPLFHKKNDCYNIRPTDQNIWVVTPHLKEDTESKIGRQKKLIDHLIYTQNISEFICWYYSPAFLRFARYLTPKLTIYDCIEKTLPEAEELEKELLQRADIVFTTENSLFEEKKKLHSNIHSQVNVTSNFLSTNKWDTTWNNINDLMEKAFINLNNIKRVSLKEAVYAI